MYLHRLELRAIGPYPDTVTIDFAALAASGVFLLEGPTGSGKSTIIDAVVFALYGGLAGSDASNDRLHSQHADPAVEPFVELVFETGAGVYRVRRSPQYDRPKQRGTGTVRQQASAQLVRLASPTDPAGEPLSARIPEVGAEIARIVGLDRAQFLQTVVLPQGEFARFLRSPGEERRKLLQSLFGTQVYDRTAEELAARRRAVLAEVEGADARVRDAAARFAQAAGVDEVTDPDQPDRAAPGVAAVVAAVDQAARRADEDRTAAVAAAAAAAAHDDRLRARGAALDRRRDLLRRRAELDEGAPAVAAARERLAVGARAGRVVGVADGLDAARDRAASARADAAVLRDRHDVEATADVHALAETIAADVARDRHLVAVAEGLSARTAALERARAERDDLGARLADLDHELAERPAERAAIVDRAAVAARSAAGLADAEHEVTRLTGLRRELDALVAAASRVGAAQDAVGTARATASSAVAAEQHLRERRIAGLAGELGAALHDGEPCPVCGAVEHPARALPQDDHPTPEAIDAAARHAREAEHRLADAAAELAVERAEQQRLAQVVGDLDGAALAERLLHAEQDVAAARAAVDEGTACEQSLAAHDEGTRRREHDRHELVTRRAVLDTALAADTDALERDADAVAAALTRLVGHTSVLVAPDSGTSASPQAGARGVEPGLGTLVRSLDRRVEVLRTIAAADAAVAESERVVADRVAEVETALAEHGFDDVLAARAAVLDEPTERELRRQVDAAVTARAVVDAGLDEPAVRAAADDADADFDLEASAAERDRTSAAAEDAVRVAVTAADRTAAVERCAADLRRAVRARDDTSARSRAVVRLADVANGSGSANPTGITLGTYVLMRRFEDVVAAANDRLRTMLGGRFTLETSDERESGSRARRTGLALAVHDHTTDSVRDPRSLSGGETFTVSLCLALGLADVVQAEAGGVSLGTLFVDEGFGTLDPEALDGVLAQLARLTAGGRQVGIVSHVEELKQRIPERIAVRRTASGASRVTTTV